jgi:putative transposase
MHTSYTLEPGNYYHIYNRGINSCDIFSEEDNYSYFLNLYDKYINPIADTFAWVLMPNHFHLLVRIKSEQEIGIYKSLNSDGSKDSVRFQTESHKNLSESEGPDRVDIKKPNPTKHFSHLFNAYAKTFNKHNNRHGSLFERPFKRKLIDDENYFKQLVLYIHNNPVHHGFCSHPIEYGWSSYLTCVSIKPTKLKRNETMEWFDDEENFKFMHNKTVEIIQIEEWLGIE